MRLGCVIMASGEGKRFGGNKLLADVAGKPLVRRTIESAPTGFDVVVSTRWPEVADICRDAHCACVLHDGALRSRSVRAGLSWGKGRGWMGCLFLPGDQPLVSPQSFRALRRAFAEADCASPVRLALNGEPASPVLFPARCFAALMRLEGKDGGGAVLRGQNDIELVEARAYELWDVDTRHDLQRVSEHFAVSSYFDKLAAYTQKGQS